MPGADAVLIWFWRGGWGGCVGCPFRPERYGRRWDANRCTEARGRCGDVGSGVGGGVEAYLGRLPTYPAKSGSFGMQSIPVRNLLLRPGAASAGLSKVRPFRSRPLTQAALRYWRIFRLVYPSTM